MVSLQTSQIGRAFLQNMPHQSLKVKLSDCFQTIFFAAYKPLRIWALRLYAHLKPLANLYNPRASKRQGV